MESTTLTSFFLRKMQKTVEFQELQHHISQKEKELQRHTSKMYHETVIIGKERKGN